jgi:hypothetical protein
MLLLLSLGELNLKRLSDCLHSVWHSPCLRPDMEYNHKMVSEGHFYGRIVHMVLPMGQRMPHPGARREHGVGIGVATYLYLLS